MRRTLLLTAGILLVGQFASCGGEPEGRGADAPSAEAHPPAAVQQPAQTAAQPPVAPVQMAAPPPTMGGGGMPADSAAIPPGERLTWGAEPIVAASATRSEVVLNGLWQFVPNAGDKPHQPEGDWGWMRVPGSWRTGGWPPNHGGFAAAGHAAVWKDFGEGEQVYAAWYQRPIRIPSTWSGRKVVLELGRVGTDATVYLDGHEVGAVTWPTGRIDLTAAMKPGTDQQLRILVLASAGAKEFASFMGTATEQVSTVKAEVRVRGLIGDVTLTAIPAGPEISEVFAKPTVEGGTRLDLELTLDGATGAGPATVVARLTGSDGKPVGTYEQGVTLAAQASQVVAAGWPVPGVRLWDVGQPNLYDVEVSLRGAGIDDSQRVRFGFRQFRVDGKRFLLNGSEIRLRPNLPSSSGALVYADETRMHIAQRLRQGYNLTELWPGSIQRRGTEDFQEVAASVADESGWLITGMLPHLGDFINGSGLDAPALAEALRPFRRLRNHPSIIMWGSSGNYFGHNTDQDPRNLGRRGFADADPEYRKRAKAGNDGLALYRAMDPTRPQFTHHGGDVGDIHTCNNYLNLLPLQEREEWLSAWATGGNMPFWPVEFETPLNLSLERDRNNHYNADTSEPLMSEYCASYLGEAAYALEPESYRAQMVAGYEGKDRWRFRSVSMDTAPAFQDLQVLNQRAVWRSWRALGSTILPLPWMNGYADRGTARKVVDAPPFVPGSRGPWLPRQNRDPHEELPAARALGAFDPQGAGGPTLAYIANVPGDDPAELVAKDHHAEAGSTVRKTILLINDLRESAAWSARWTATLGGRQVGAGDGGGTLAIAGRGLLPISIAVPAGAERGELLISMEAHIGDRTHTDSFAVQVYPRLAPAGGTVLAADPQGDSSKALAALGFTVQAWDGRPAAGKVVVIGRHAFADPAVRALDITAHIAAGGRVVVMAQERDWYERSQGLRTSGWSSRRVFVVPTESGHPVLSGLGDADLRDWNGAGTAIEARPQALYEKFSHDYPRHGWKWGNAGTVAGLAIEKPHHGGWRPLLQCEFDLAYSPLMELGDGAGLVMWCTLDLEGRTRPDPAAALLLRRLIDHAIAWTGEAARRPAAMLGSTSRIEQLGLVGGPAVRLPADHAPVVIVADATVADEELRSWIAAGGHALVLLDASHGRLGFGVATQAKHLGSLKPPTWPEARGLSASDLRLRNVIAMAVLSGAPAGGEIAADGLLARLEIGSGVAILTTIDPPSLPVADQPWLRGSQWRWTRTLAQLAGNLGIRARGDGKALLADLGRDAPRPLSGVWRMQVERALPPTTPDHPHALIPLTDRGPANADTAGWLPIEVPGAWEGNQTQYDGATWVRRHVDIPAAWAGHKLVVELGPLDDHDTTWFNGERIGGMGDTNPDAWRTGRSYSIKPELVKAGPAVIAVRVWDWFGGGGFGAAKAEELRLRRADGQDEPIALGGTWLGRIELAVPPAKSPGELRDPGIAAHAATWHLPGTDDRAWQPVRMPQLFEAAFADIDGAVWLRTAIDVPAHWAGRELELHLGRIGDADATFAEGQLIGSTTGTTARVYRIPAALVRAGPLPIAVRVFNAQGPGGLLGPSEDLFLALPGDIAGAPWYERGWRSDFSTGDDPFRYYRW